MHDWTRTFSKMFILIFFHPWLRTSLEKHLRWNFLQKQLAVNYFRKKLHFQCLALFWIHLWWSNNFYSRNCRWKVLQFDSLKHKKIKKLLRIDLIGMNFFNFKFHAIFNILKYIWYPGNLDKFGSAWTCLVTTN